jgi:hypothetical protein
MENVTGYKLQVAGNTPGKERLWVKALHPETWNLQLEFYIEL